MGTDESDGALRLDIDKLNEHERSLLLQVCAMFEAGVIELTKSQFMKSELAKVSTARTPLEVNGISRTLSNSEYTEGYTNARLTAGFLLVKLVQSVLHAMAVEANRLEVAQGGENDQNRTH